MSKKFERDEKIIDRLELENRNLKSENRLLRKRLKSLSKGYHKFLLEDGQNEAVEEAQEIAKKICFQCGIGEYKEIIVVNRRWRQCQECGKKGKVSII